MTLSDPEPIAELTWVGNHMQGKLCNGRNGRQIPRASHPVNNNNNDNENDYDNDIEIDKKEASYQIKILTRISGGKVTSGI